MCQEECFGTNWTHCIIQTNVTIIFSVYYFGYLQMSAIIHLLVTSCYLICLLNIDLEYQNITCSLIGYPGLNLLFFCLRSSFPTDNITLLDIFGHFIYFIESVLTTNSNSTTPSDHIHLLKGKCFSVLPFSLSLTYTYQMIL